LGNIQVQIDLGGEKLIGAERGKEKIAVEIKTFSNQSFITAFYEAVGKYVVYRNVLRLLQPERTLYLALPEDIHKRFFGERVIQETMKEEKFKLVIYNQTTQIITEWLVN
jgi:XisH protein